MTPLIFEGTEYRWYNHLFAVSQAGAILRKGVPITPRVRPDGYLEIGRRHLVHRMVAFCWVEKPGDATDVHHINGNKADPRAGNLEWVTPKTHMGDRHKGATGKYERTDEIRAKLRAFRTGLRHSEETKQKQRAVNLRLGIKPPPRTLGYKCSALAIDKMRKNSPNAVGCEINGTRYRSFSEAGRALGAKPHTLRKRCLSGSFSGYRIIKSD